MASYILSATNNDNWAQWLIFALYMTAIIAVALFTRKKSKTVEGFMFANKGVGGWFSAFAYGATYFSAVIFVGYAGKFGWNFGISAVWIGIGNMLIGTLLAWVVLAKRTKVMTATLNARTMPEFFEKRYNSKHIKLVSSLVIFIFLLPYSASVYQGMGYIFEAVLGIDAIWCILILAGLTALYLFLGGYFATTITDFIQGIIMLVGIVVVLFTLLSKDAVNWGEGLSSLTQNGLGFIASSDVPEGGTFMDSPLFNILILTLLTSFGIWGLPQSVHKFYAIKDDAAIRKGAVVSTVFAAVVGCSAYLMGSLVTLFVSEETFTGTLGGNFDKVVPEMLVQNLSPALLGLIIVLLFSASMSTLAAMSLSSSSTVTVDFVKGYVKKDMPEKNTGILLRVLCLVFVAISAVLAIAQIDAIVTMMSLSWGAIAGCFIGPYVYGLYSKKSNKAGAYASIIFCLLLTFALVIGLGYFTAGDGATFGQAVKAGIGRSPFIGVLSMVGSMIVTPIASLLFSNKSAVDNAVVDELFSNDFRVFVKKRENGKALTAESYKRLTSGESSINDDTDSAEVDAKKADK